VRLLRPTSSEWNAHVGRARHDFFHTAEYHRIAEEFGNGKAWLAVYGTADRFVAWPYILQQVDAQSSSLGPLWDVTSAYGYGGPVQCGCAGDDAFLASAWAAMVDAWRSQHVVSVFARFHPLLDNWRYVPCLRNVRQTDPYLGEDVSEGKTVAIDLTRSEAEIEAGYDRRLRQALRRLSKTGMFVTLDPQWIFIEDFIRMYYATMRRNNARSIYFFPNQYFCKLKKALGSHGSLIIAKIGEAVTGAGLLIEYHGIVNLHLLATDDRFVDCSPSKLIIHEAQAWARVRGNQILHLGGGRRSSNHDSLFRFKALFSNAFFRFDTGRWILDENVYETLTRERQTQVNSFHDKSVPPYFPAYRAPIEMPLARDV
jgi:Acetyltransferase (GNAT) domain